MAQKLTEFRKDQQRHAEPNQVLLGLLLSWPELLRVVGWVFRLILAMSFLFEFVVSAFIRHPVPRE